jgi:predicted nuclease of predicted toxin-antitoxin system
MQWLIDAQLPRRLALSLNRMGYVATHTLDLPFANATTDFQVIAAAEEKNAVVVTKDYDFVNYFHLHSKPRLLLISTGNIANNDLLELVIKQLPQLEAGFILFDFIEITRTQLIYHA